MTRARLLLSSLNLGAALFLTIAGCRRPDRRVEYATLHQASLQSAAVSSSAARSTRAPLPRSQHTTGLVGETLFPALTSDRRTLYFSSSRHGPNYSIYRKEIDAAPWTLLTGGEWSDIHPAPSPDCAWIAFSSDRDGLWSLYLLDASGGGQPRRLTESGGDAFGPSWSPDGRRVAFFRSGARTGGYEIWLLDVETRTEAYLTDGLFPAWSPATHEGEWIAYQKPRERDGAWYSLWKIRPDGASPTEILRADTWGAVHPSWSPDGEWLVFAAAGKEPPAGTPESPMQRPRKADDLYLVRASGASLTDLTGDRESVAEWNPSFGPDGRIYFNCDSGGGVNVWSLDPKIGSVRVPVREQ